MNLCIGMTVTDRPELLRDTLVHWSRVRGVTAVPFLFFVEPTDRLQEVMEVMSDYIAWAERENPRARVGMVLNRERKGPLENPYYAMETMLVGTDRDYAILAEDDVSVSSDILEYHQWCAERYRNDSLVAAVCSFSKTNGSVRHVTKLPTFSPLLWGTWADRWLALLGPTWDHDYSSGTAPDNYDAGWDHNLARRVVPSLGMSCIFPGLSRSQHQGELGAHCTPALFPGTRTRFWVPDVPPLLYHEALEENSPMDRL